MSPLPNQHPQRLALHNEIHARPPDAMSAPMAVSLLVMVCDAGQREASRDHVAQLLRGHHLSVPDAQTTHVRADVGAVRLRWEQHTEFVSWGFTRALPGDGTSPAEPETAISAVPQDWLAGLPGECVASVHLWALPVQSLEATGARVRQLLNEDALVGSLVADGHAQVYTDFAIHPDGFSRFLLLSDRIGERRLGRLVQQILEIDTYRMAALLGLPAAREASAVLGQAERELAELAGAIRAAASEQEPALLDRLTRLAGQVESHHAATHSRFSASAAYFELVDRRIADIGESRLAGLQTIGEFMDRRLSPARATCAWAARRQEALSQRVSRISNLLRTRVEIEQQQSSRSLLDAMNRRQALQLQLQSTVEGLSVAAITYYIVGLVSYLAKAGQALGWPLSPEASAACAIPVVALAVWWSLRSLHARLGRAE